MDSDNKMIELIIWMNIPSHHQMAFFEELSQQDNVDLIVKYYDQIPVERKKLGWGEFSELPKYQSFIDSANIEQVLDSIEGWKRKIHIIPGFSHPFLVNLLGVLIRNEVSWIHWSERTGKPFTKLLNFRYNLVKVLYPFHLFLNGYYAFAKKINNYAIGAFAFSELARLDFEKWGVQPSKIKVLNYSLKQLSFFEEEIIPEKQFLYVGSLTKHKGVDILIKSFSRLNNAKKWQLKLLGNDTSNGKLKGLAKKLGVRSSVLFCDAVPFEKINEHILQASLLILPTLFDGWGAVLNEASSLGKPLIATDQSGAAFHLIVPSKNGFRVKANSVSALKEAMQFYVDNPDMLEVHGQYSLKVFKNFTPHQTAQNFIKGIEGFVTESNAKD